VVFPRASLRLLPFGNFLLFLLWRALKVDFLPRCLRSRLRNPQGLPPALYSEGLRIDVQLRYLNFCLRPLTCDVFFSWTGHLPSPRKSFFGFPLDSLTIRIDARGIRLRRAPSSLTFTSQRLWRSLLLILSSFFVSLSCKRPLLRFSSSAPPQIVKMISFLRCSKRVFRRFE